MSDKTVRSWVGDGLLTSRSVRPRLLLDAERLHTVLRFLGDLRAAGQDRDFRDDLWNKLQDEALLVGALHHKERSSYDQFLQDLRANGCASLNYRLSGDDLLSKICVAHLAGALRVVTAFYANNAATIEG